jgi:ABC-type multidrug transport system ATPase subunit
MILSNDLASRATADPRDAVVQTRGLTKYFGSKCAVDSVSFSVPRGSVFAFIGRNGAGKTTTIRMILGLLEPTRGSSAILTRQRERTIFFSTHLLDDVERVADKVAVLDYSVLRVCGGADTFRERVRRLVVRFPGEPPRKLPPIPGLLRATRSENELSLIIANANGRAERELEALGALAVDEQPMSLEDALIAHVGRQGDKGFFLNTTGGTR